MTRKTKRERFGLLDLFGQPPVDTSSIFFTNGLVADARTLAQDWQQVGLYLNNAMIQWDKQQLGRKNDPR